MSDLDLGNEWIGWMIFKHKGNQIGLVQSSFSLSKESVEQALKMRGGAGEKIHRVRLTLCGDTD